MSNREEFEKWARKNDFDLGSYCNGYGAISTRAAWETWQARQPEIDALKTELTHMKSESEHAALVDEIDRLKSGNERLRKLAEEYVSFMTQDKEDCLEEIVEFINAHTKKLSAELEGK